MSLYDAYLEQIENRKEQGLKPKPIDDGGLVKELVAQIKDAGHAHRAASLDFFIYNTLPGTTSAAGEKAAFLKEIILGEAEVPEISAPSPSSCSRNERRAVDQRASRPRAWR
ncbi:MAG: hypothetical protein CM15mP115_09710 [Alphaproteobacteria bacterium]|nr:MAG: hypothetical protein CM15mP115_09710 [Alphaproteobacteria bacterium]